MPKPLAPNATLSKMIYALAWTFAALKAAAKLDFKRTPEERKKFDEVGSTLTKPLAIRGSTLVLA